MPPARYETRRWVAESDGNGRTGRALVHAMLKAKGTVSHTTAPVSAGLLRDTGPYFRALDAYRAGDARPIVDRICEASIFASRSGTHLVDDLAAHLDDARARTAHLRADAAARKVLPHLVGSPVVNTRHLVDHLGIPPSSAARALDQLTAAGVLEERTGRRRERLWQHSGVIATLDAYAQQTIRH